jgi:hypothetical protein
MEFLADINWFYLLVSAFAGGAFAAAIGALPAFIFTGIMVIGGEAASVATGGEVGSITGQIAFGPFFGPHVSFAAGAAASAYAAKKGYMETGFDFHESKNIAAALGPKIDVMLVGGAFGVIGLIITTFSAGLNLPWDPIAIAVTLSALLHRAFLGYSILGKAEGKRLDMTPFEEGVNRADPAGLVSDMVKNATDRLAVEPWLPHQYKWGQVAGIGLFAGILGAFTAIETGSPFLAFGISAASLFFLNLGVEKFPVTHHITLPASTIALAAVATGDGMIAGASDGTAVILGGLLGLVCALFGELFQRIFYAHGDTHWDPPAAAIVFGTFLIALMYFAGILSTGVWIPGTTG